MASSAQLKISAAVKDLGIEECSSFFFDDKRGTFHIHNNELFRERADGSVVKQDVTYAEFLGFGKVTALADM